MKQIAKIGISHKCDCEKVDITNFKKTLLESFYSPEEILHIWDFYVSNYGNNLNKKDFTGRPILERPDEVLKELIKIGGIELFCTIRSKKIENTLKNADLQANHICVEHPRIVLKRNYLLTSDENDDVGFVGGPNAENELNCLFRHIRNALAHNICYFFDNGNVLLEDKDNKDVSARILINKDTLIKWIDYINGDKIVENEE